MRPPPDCPFLLDRSISRENPERECRISLPLTKLWAVPRIGQLETKAREKAPRESGFPPLLPRRPVNAERCAREADTNRRPDERPEPETSWRTVRLAILFLESHFTQNGFLGGVCLLAARDELRSVVGSRSAAGVCWQTFPLNLGQHRQRIRKSLTL